MLALKDYINTGTLVGFFLAILGKEMGEAIARRRANRKQVARVLAELLEIRHSVVALDSYSQLLSRETGIPDAVMPHIRHFVLQFLPSETNMVQRYNAAIDEIAGFDPLLAFSLRSREVFQTFNHTMDQLSSKDPEIASSWQAYGPDINNIAKKYLDQALLGLAWKFSVITWYRVRRWVRKPYAPPAEFRTFLEKLKAEVEKAKAADAAAAAVGQ